MKRQYLAYTILLAGWLIFCYWLYSKEIYPRLHSIEGTRWPIIEEDLALPIAYRWGSDIPHAGNGFEKWMHVFTEADSLNQTIVLRGHFYRDEVKSFEEGRDLAANRIKRVIRYLNLDRNFMLTEVVPSEITSDVKSSFFEAITYEIYSPDQILNKTMDSIELCFPLKDSFLLTSVLWDQLDKWIDETEKEDSPQYIITGTADGTGISESMDMGWERALIIQNRMLANGINEDQLEISTAQRSAPEPIQNRCVVINIEQNEKR